ncbi:MAG: rhomboid family intramembrane serine protease [Thermoplasmata archaeon]|nr:rhomboid family intramembrane serine protease [Thermoplasmata archaeon]
MLAVILAAVLYAYFKKAYLSQMMVIANFIIFVVFVVMNQMNEAGAVDIYRSLAFVPARLFDLRYAPTLITSMFIHSGWMHAIGNILILYLIGLPLEERIGTKNWGIIYFSTGIAATISFYLLHMDAETYLLGASGAIFGIAGALLILYPKDKILLPIPLFFIMIFRRVQVWIAVGLLFVIETVLVFMSVEDGVAHIAHVGGAVAGIFLAPLIVEKMASSSGSAKGKKLDIDVLRQIAGNDPGQLAIIEKLEDETLDDVREAWLDEFFKKAECPACHRKLERANKIKCQCGKEFKILE